MLLIFNTKDRESDLILWSKYKKSNFRDSDQISSYDCSEEKDLNFFTEAISNISMFKNEKKIIVAHNLVYSKNISKLIESSEDEIILISPSGRWSSYKGKQKKISKAITDNEIKNEISGAIKDFDLSSSRFQISDLYNAISIKTYSGKSRLSPVMAEILIRRLKSISDPSNATSKDLELEYIISQADKQINQWKVIDFLFSNNKKQQYIYFSELTKSTSPFELIAQIKSILFLLRIISESLEKGLDSSSIAKKLKKHPFYISSLTRTLRQYRKSKKELEKLVLRFMKLEFMLKSGKFEDEQFGFEILLATI